jgi:HAD superfamily hydrolase (TIGR01509 family)
MGCFIIESIEGITVMMTVAKGVKGLIFDCDGTLADTMPIHIEAWAATFAARGISCPPDFIEHVKGMPAENIIAEFNRRYNHTIDTRSFAKEKNHRAQQQLGKAQPIQPVVDIVLQHLNILPMAVASGGTRGNVILTLDAIGLTHCFQTIITSDDSVAPKPDPQIFLEGARRLGVEPSLCQVFEDGNPGLEAARRAGMVATDVRKFI